MIRDIDIATVYVLLAMTELLHTVIGLPVSQPE